MSRIGHRLAIDALPTERAFVATKHIKEFYLFKAVFEIAEFTPGLLRESVIPRLPMRAATDDVAPVP
ncbi:MAG: hypothetical protein ACREVR_18995 [Burkholderiales bacterium]